MCCYGNRFSPLGAGMLMPNRETMYRMNTRRPTTAKVPEKAIAVDFRELLWWAGAKRLRKATQAVRVYRMDTLVLMVTIWPNFENGCITVLVKGIAATIVVRALLVMLTPMWLMAARVRHCRSLPASCNKIKLQVIICHNLTSYVTCTTKSVGSRHISKLSFYVHLVLQVFYFRMV